MTTYPKPVDPVSGLTRADGTTKAHSDDHGRIIDIHENVKHYGCVGDGVVDDTVALTAAIAACDGGQALYFPPGIYKITSTITLDTYQKVRFIGIGSSVNISGATAPGVLIDSRTVTTGPAFSYNGANNNQTATHYWENINILAGRTGWYYNNSARGTFRDCGGKCYTNDGNVDNAVVVLQNSFLFDFRGGAFESASTSDPAIILRGAAADFDTSSTYLVTFDNIRFTFGAVNYEWNTGAASPGSAVFRDCYMESSNGLPMFKFIESGSHSATFIVGVQMFNCTQFDQNASAALLEIDTPNATLQRPLLVHCAQGVGNPGILITNGSCEMARMIGGTNTQLGSFVFDASSKSIGSIRDRDHGTDHIETNDASEVLVTTLTNRTGPLWRFAKNGDDYARAGIGVDGTLYWGPGGSTSTGWDANLARTATAFMTMTGSFKTASAFIQRIQNLTDAATVATDASTGNIFHLSTSSSRTMGAPTNGTAGQTITYRINNASAGAITTGWNGAFSLAGASWTDPGAGKKRTITFYFDGGTWYETGRAGGDM